MSVVEIDERGRVTIPRQMRVEADKALVIPMGDTYMVIPIPKVPIEFEMKETGKAAKKKAEKKLTEEARGRAIRRRQA